MSVAIVRKLKVGYGGFKQQHECYSARDGYRVKCTDCGWTGYRQGLHCECYDENAWYCRPWGPGYGCPSGILWPCPKCHPPVKQPAYDDWAAQLESVDNEQ